MRAKAQFKSRRVFFLAKVACFFLAYDFNIGFFGLWGSKMLLFQCFVFVTLSLVKLIVMDFFNFNYFNDNKSNFFFQKVPSALETHNA